MSAPATYRGWAVRNDNPPAPASSSGWSATSPDYDVDCDSESCWEVAGQQVHAATYDALVAEIDAAIVDDGTKAPLPDGCPTCGALPCDWAAGGEDDVATVRSLVAERDADHANINLKADFIDKSLDQLAQADQTIAELLATLELFRDEVTQEDRDEAAKWLRSVRCIYLAQWIEGTGEAPEWAESPDPNDYSLVQAFARHRVAAVAKATGGAA